MIPYNYYYMAYINNKLKAVFLHNVKCGGCYIRNILLEYYNFEGIFIEDHAHLTNCVDERAASNCKYLFLNQYKGVQTLSKYFIFTFVRNPYDKLYSAYNYLKQELTKTNYERIKSVEENKEYFTDFNTFVKNHKQVNAISQFHAFITQRDCLSDLSGNIMLNYIGRLETIDIDLLCILNILNIDDIKHDNVLFFEKKINKSSDETFNIAFDYNEESFNFVNKYFEDDFKLFQYKKYNSLNEFREEYEKKIKENNPTHCLAPIPAPNSFVLENENILQILELYRSAISLKYGIAEQERICEKTNKIIEELFYNEFQISISKLGFSETNRNFIELFENQQIVTERNKREIHRINKKICTLIRDSAVINICTSCNVSFYNHLSYFSHIIICKNKLKELL